MNPSDDRGHGHTARGDLDRAIDRVRDAVLGHKLLILLGIVAIVLQSSSQGMTVAETINQWIAAIPPEAWVAGRYAGIAAVPGLGLGYVVYQYFYETGGVEVLVLGTSRDDAKHLRIGREKWDQMIVVDQDGDEIGTDELHQITLNGRTGYELLDYDREYNVAVASWMGGASASELRAYRHAVTYIQRYLSAQADRYQQLRANETPIVREAAEQSINKQIRQVEEATIPEGEQIEISVQDALDQTDDILASDVEIDMEDPRSNGVPTAAEAGAEVRGDGSETNGGGDGAE